MSNDLVFKHVDTHEDKEFAVYQEPRLRDIPVHITTIARIPLLALIRIYQNTISRVLPSNTCRFTPSCSHYGYRAIYKYGLFKGSLMAAWRILRCNPFNTGGNDPVQ